MEEHNPEIFEKYFNALMEISRAITSDRYLEDILKLIVMVTAKVTEAEVCSLWLIEENKNGKTLRLKTTQAIEYEYVKDRTLNMDEGVVGYVATHNKPLIVKHVLEEPRFKEKEMAKKLGLVSMVGVPMQVQDGKVIGVINCFTTSAHDFTEAEINLITAVANQSAVAIFNTKLMFDAQVIREELETRKLVEKAKEILMMRRKISGEDAFKWMRKRSMDTRKSMRNIAEALILSEELNE
ncbi:MAG: ANTAR domain-containing protein [Proteobacteria bacterium]|nr:ANTAR domain-containing protein [Pseudomonadota bacterium]